MKIVQKDNEYLYVNKDDLIKHLKDNKQLRIIDGT
jgi:hypothetical protein